MAQYRATTTCKHRGHPLALPLQRVVPDRIHAAVNLMKSTAPEPVSNCFMAHTGVKQLPTSNHPMLTAGQISDRPINANRFCGAYSPINIGLLGHRPSMAPRSTPVALGKGRKSARIVPRPRRGLSHNQAASLTAGFSSPWRTPAPASPTKPAPAPARRPRPRPTRACGAGRPRASTSASKPSTSRDAVGSSALALHLARPGRRELRPRRCRCRSSDAHARGRACPARRRGRAPRPPRRGRR